MRAALAALSLALVIVLQAVPVGQSRRVSVGVLRRDGILIPFGTFDGRRWSSHWPKPELNPEIPINLQSVPSRWWGGAGAIDTWEAWLLDGSHRAVHATRPDVFPVQCFRQIGLHTDYKASETPPPLNEQPYPKDALAVAPPHLLEPIASVPLAGDDAAAIGDALLDAFNRAERVTSAYGLELPVKREARERIAPTIEAFYAHGADPRVYYVEAARRYEQFGSRDCILVAFGTGWFVRERGSFRPLAMTVDELDCARRDASYMLPFGVLRIGTRVFWVVQFSGWDHERYVIVEPVTQRVEAALSVWAGGCS